MIQQGVGVHVHIYSVETINPSGYKCTPSGFLGGIPKCPQAWKMKNVDDTLFYEGYDSGGVIGPFYNAVLDEVATGYDFEEYSMPTKEKLDSPDNVNAFLITPAAYTDVGGASAGPGKFVEIFSDAINRKRADG